MLFRSGKNWIFDLFKRRGWLVRRHPIRRRSGAWNHSSVVAAECQIMEQRTLLSTITVTSLADTLNAGAGVTLRDAIQAANTDTSVDGSVAGQAGAQDVIVFQTGLNGKIALTNGQLAISSSIAIHGLNAANTVIDAQHNSRVFDITSTAGDVTLDRMTIENGKTIDNGSQDIVPGTGEGGAIRSVSTGTLTVSNSSLTGNATAGSYAFGGAIYASGALTVTNCSLTANATTGADASGGAIDSSGTLTITNSSLSGNTTSGANAKGGAIFSSSRLSVMNSTLSGNSTAGDFSYGGAIAANGTATVTNSTLSTNSTSGNYAYGGAIAGNDLTVTNSTVAQNHATHATGGGIRGFRAGPVVTLRNSILAQNTDNGTAPDLDPGTGAAITVTHSLIGDNLGAGLSAAPVGSPDANGNLIGTHAAPIDPRLGALDYNGGATQTMALLAGSPAIEAGSNAQATDPGRDGIGGTADDISLSTDQRGTGFVRVLGAVDMGAFEIQPLFAGEYAVATSGSSTLSLASIAQTSGTQMTLNGSTTATAVIASATQLQIGGAAATYGNSQITFGSTGPFANQVWTKLDLPADYTNQGGATVHIIQNGASVQFVDKLGNVSAGHWISPTQLYANLWNETVTTATGKLLWQDGSIWSENLVLSGVKPDGSPITVSATPSQVSVFDYVNASDKAVHLVQTGTNNVIFVDGTGHMSIGSFISPTQLSTPYFPNDIATISNDMTRITWSDGGVWTATARTSAITVIDYTNQLGVPVHLVKNGTNQLGFVDGLGRTSLGTMLSATTAQADLYPGDVATFSGNTVSWQDGYTWTQTAVVPLMIMFTDTNGAVSHVKVTGPTTMAGLDRALQGLTATRQNNKLIWSNGQIWNISDLNALHAFFEMGTGYP